ncbi:MAG: hypothetical protein J7484_10595 [Microbacterium sp.]|nr:hypothetical protein [Microbacterium sp.]
MAASEVTVSRERNRERMLWLIAGSILALSAAIQAFQRMPGALDGGTMAALGWTSVAAFGVAMVVAGLALWSTPGPAPVMRAASVSCVALGVWAAAVAPLVLRALASEAASGADALPYVDAIVRIVLCGIATGCLARSDVAAPWRYLPLIAFGVVVAARLSTQIPAQSADAQSALLALYSLVMLVEIVATATLAAVAFRLARPRSRSTVVL